MPREQRREIKQRAKRIRKIAVNKEADSAKDYLQYTLVVLVILIILAGAIYLTQS